ncbi:MAG: ABC transporter permease subunit [Acidobacteriota bacterium]
MRNVLAIARKEFRSYFASVIAYLFITLFLGVSSWLFMSGFFITRQATMRSFFDLMPWYLLFFIPAVTMRLWAEEKKLGTIELLMTFPLRDSEVVFGKFLAAFAFVGLTLALSFPLALTVAYAGDPDWGAIAGGYLGSLLLGASYLAIGLFASSLTENQIVAFLLAVVGSFFLYIIGIDMVLYPAPEVLVGFLSYLSLATHFKSIQRGVIDSRDVIYYASLVGFFLFLNVRAVESRKWK